MPVVPVTKIRPALLPAFALAAVAALASPVWAQDAPPPPEASAPGPGAARAPRPPREQAGRPTPMAEPVPATAPLPPGRVVGGEPALAPVPGRRFSNQNETDPVRRAYNEGRDLVSDREWEKAVAKFNEIMSKYPKDKLVDSALYYYAFSLKKQGKYDDSWRALERLAAEYPTSRWLKDVRALQYEIAPIIGRIDFVDAESKTREDVELKIYALRALADSSPDRARAAIRDILKPGSTAPVELKRGAVMIIGDLGGDDVRPTLLEIIRSQSEDADVRRHAIFALGSLMRRGGAVDEVTFNALKDLIRSSNDLEIAKTALYAIAEGNDPRTCQLVTELATSAQNVEIRRHSIMVLGSNERCATIEALEQVYTSAPDDDIRRFALMAIGQRRDPRSLDFVLRVARTAPTTDLRRHAMMILAERDPGRAVQVLTELYDSEKDETVKESIIDSLGMIEDRRALEKLLKIGRTDPSTTMKRKAIFWIGQSKDPEAMKFLEELLK